MMQPEMKERYAVLSRRDVAARLCADQRSAENGDPHQQDGQRGKAGLHTRVQKLRNRADEDIRDEPPEPNQGEGGENGSGSIDETTVHGPAPKGMPLAKTALASRSLCPARNDSAAERGNAVMAIMTRR